MDLGMILCAYGFETIDENLENLIQNMATFPESGLIGQIQGYAKIIALLIAMGVGAYECWMMMLGRRGMDVMKILRIIIISICITCSGWICEAAQEPGKALGEAAQKMAMAENAKVKENEKKLIGLQEEYLKKIDNMLNNAKAQEEQDKNALQKLGDLIDEAMSGELLDNAINRMKSMALGLEMKVLEFVSSIIRFIGEVLFQMSYYGMLVAQNIFSHLLWAFCPIAFAISLAPPYKSAWSQWLSKFISISLWAFIVYMILYYVNYIMEYNLQNDIDTYTKLINNFKADGNIDTVGSLGLQGLGTTCMYVVGLLVGVFCLKFVPEVASWLIPGGVSSGAGGMTGAGGGIMSTMGGQTSKVASAIGKQAQKNLSVGK